MRLNNMSLSQKGNINMKLNSRNYKGLPFQVNKSVYDKFSACVSSYGFLFLEAGK
jgi:hypothetical protein